MELSTDACQLLQRANDRRQTLPDSVLLEALRNDDTRISNSLMDLASVTDCRQAIRGGFFVEEFRGDWDDTVLDVLKGIGPRTLTSTRLSTFELVLASVAQVAPDSLFEYLQIANRETVLQFLLRRQNVDDTSHTSGKEHVQASKSIFLQDLETVGSQIGPARCMMIHLSHALRPICAFLRHKESRTILEAYPTKASCADITPRLASDAESGSSKHLVVAVDAAPVWPDCEVLLVLDRVVSALTQDGYKMLARQAIDAIAKSIAAIK